MVINWRAMNCGIDVNRRLGRKVALVRTGTLTILNRLRPAWISMSVV